MRFFWLILFLWFYVMPTAHAQLPDKALKEIRQQPDGIAIAEKYLKTTKVYQYEKEEILENILQRLNRGRSSEGLASVLNLILDDKPETTELEQMVRVLYMAKRWGAKKPIAGYEELLEKIESKSSFDRSQNLHRMIQLVYQDDFPAKVNKKKISAEEMGVYAIGSTYSDEAAPSLKRKEVGTGSLIEIPSVSNEHQYVITAAHLLGGEKPSIRIGGKDIPISPEDIVADNGVDVALVQIPKSAGGAAAFRYENWALKPTKNFQTALNQSQVPLKKVQASGAITLANLKFLGDFEKDHGDNYAEILHGEISRLSTYQAAWAQPNTSASEDSDAARSTEAVLVNGGDTINVRFESTPGMSGTFLLRETVNPEGTAVQGILSQYNLYFRDSYFTHVDRIKALIKEFANGKRGNLTATHWKMKNGLTYREFRDGYTEANFVDLPAGNGVTGDPGKGVLGDPGVETCEEESAADGNFQNIAEILEKIKRGQDAKPEEVFARFGIRPGMKWKGQSILGIKAIPKSDPGAAFLLYANPQGAQFMLEQEKDYTFEPVLDGANLAEFAMAKAKYAFRNTPSKMLKGDEVRLKATTPYYDHGDIKLTKEGVSLDFILDYGKEEPPTTVYGLDMKLKSGSRPDKFIPIRLDAQGRLPGKTSFIPIVEVKNKLGEPVRLDLRQLFFTDLSQVPLQYNESISMDEWLPRTTAEALQVSRELIQLTYRNSATGRESTATLLPRDCSLNANLEGNWINRGRYTRSTCQELSDEWK